MKSELKEYTVIKQYWTCLNNSHRHELESVANKRIAKATKVKAVSNVWDEDKRAALLKEFRDTGVTKKFLADKYKVSGSRIGAVLAKAEREEKLRYSQNQARPG